MLDDGDGDAEYEGRIEKSRHDDGRKQGCQGWLLTITINSSSSISPKKCELGASVENSLQQMDLGLVGT